MNTFLTRNLITRAEFRVLVRKAKDRGYDLVSVNMNAGRIRFFMKGSYHGPGEGLRFEGAAAVNAFLSDPMSGKVSDSFVWVPAAAAH